MDALLDGTPQFVVAAINALISRWRETRIERITAGGIPGYQGLARERMDSHGPIGNADGYWKRRFPSM